LNHQVFAVNAGESISRVRESPLLNENNVTYIEGPTQLTLPRYVFAGKVQIALIDGPHGYPFPDLEYYYFYPLIETGGLLLVDDIVIPSIQRMFEIIQADDMFELLDILDDNMAVFRRTAAPLIDPLSDSWWLQGYNRSHYDSVMRGAPSPSVLQSVYRPILRHALRGAAALCPEPLKDRLPKHLEKKLWQKM
jgi:hypothetical protein